MKKHFYEMPTIEIVSFGNTDVMLSSGNKGYQSDPFDSNPFGGALWVKYW